MISNLQLLRAAAALVVVWYHMIVLLQRLGLPVVGDTGVDLFFEISGFVMVFTTQAKRPSAGDFARNRFLRIAPLYWLITVGVFVVALVRPTVLPNTVVTFQNLWKSLAFIPYPKSNGLVQPIVFVGWSLNFEMFFYALFALGLLFRNYRMGVFCVLAVLAGFVGYGLLLEPRNLFVNFYTQPIIIEFAVGMLLGLGYPRVPAGTMSQSTWLSGSLLVLGALAFGLLVFLPSWFTGASRVFTAGVPGAIVIIAALRLELAGWNTGNRFVLLLGEASYAIYLSHLFVTQTVQKLIVASGSQGWIFDAGLLLLSIALVVVVGVAVHRWIEVPLSQALRRWIQAHVARRAKAALV